MQILTVDVGTGTQDILLFDSRRTPENCLKLVMPSPTLRIAQRVRQATAAGMDLLITGVIMGGGPCSWAVEDHRRAGLRVFATPDPARTFNDDLARVERELGVVLVDEAEAAARIGRNGLFHVEFRDFDYPAIHEAFAAFGVDLRPDALALAVFDHGAAPSDISDRQFRMDYMTARLVQDPRLSAFAVPGDRVPAVMTRLQALAATAQAQTGLPVIVMDTAAAAVLGALEDPRVAAHANPLIVNVGNFHCLAFQMHEGRLLRLFEHHTGELTRERLVGWLRALADGSIRHEAVFADKGHGALLLGEGALGLDLLAVVGPRRSLLVNAGLPAYFAVPHGDQMLAGCFGLLRACADVVPEWRAEIVAALAGEADQSLW